MRRFFNCKLCRVRWDTSMGLTRHMRQKHGIVLPKKPKRMGPVTLKREIRRAIADYMFTEGCGCCSNRDTHSAHEKQLAKLLHVPLYDDKSGYDFGRYRTKTGEA